MTMVDCSKVILRITMSLLFLNPIFANAQVAWVKSFDAALKQAAKENKFIVLDVSASWCPHCRKMAREVYPSREFVEFSRKNVFMRVFADTDPEGNRLAKRFGVDGYPTLIVLNSDGQEIDRIMGERSVEDLIEELKSIFQSASRRHSIRL